MCTPEMHMKSTIWPQQSKHHKMNHPTSQIFMLLSMSGIRSSISHVRNSNMSHFPLLSNKLRIKELKLSESYWTYVHNMNKLFYDTSKAFSQKKICCVAKISA